MKKIEIIEDKREIYEIINEKIKGKRLVFTDWYKEGILKRGIEQDEVMKVFYQFEKVNRVEKEKLSKGDIGFELFYKVGDYTTFSIATIPKNEKLLIVHAIKYKRNLDYRFKKFKL